MGKEIVTILCSGASLGAYIPGLIASNQLRKRGVNTEVVVLENILLQEKRDNVLKTKFAFHRNFSLALMGQKLAKDISPSIDLELADNLLTTWETENRQKFLIFSGFWVPIAYQYLQRANIQGITMDLCHLDASISTSWKFYDTTHRAFHHIWFFNWDNKSLYYNFCVSDHEPVSYDRRCDRFLIHGGGWGLGTYKSKISELEQQGFQLDVIVYESRDINHRKKGNRYFMIDPNWKPWEKDSQNQHQFPPFAQIQEDISKIQFQNNNVYPEVYKLIKHSRAIISKPGGGTLIDSLCAATPLVLLEPYGDYERANGLLWEKLGFAISYDKWANYGYSQTILKKLHDNIKAAKAKLPEYIDSYVNAIK